MKSSPAPAHLPLFAAVILLPFSPALAGKPPLLIDGHNHLFIHYMDCKECPRDFRDYDLASTTTGDTDIPRLRAGGVGVVLVNVFPARDSTFNTLEAFDFLRRLEVTYHADLQIAATTSDIARIHKEGCIAIVPTMESAYRLENSPMMVRTLHRLGLRAVTLAYRTNDLADAADDKAVHGGLSRQGRLIVEEMNRTGVLVDLSHVAETTMNDTLDIAKAPVIFSHSSARALVDVERNVPDSVLKRLPDNGGMVMVSLVPYFTTVKSAEWMEAMEGLSDEITRDVSQGRLTESAADERWAQWASDNPEPKVTVADVADHIEHVRKIAGVDHVGIGSDFDGITKKISGLEDVSTFPVVLSELRRRGWSEEDIRKVAGANFLRVMRAAEQAASTLREN